MSQQHLGVIGLGVMGRNLAFNAENKGFSAAGFDVSPDKLKEMSAAAAGKNVLIAKTLKEFTDALDRPRRILMMVPAGAPVDSVLRDLKPFVDKDDIVIDGGNSYYKDTERRTGELDAAGLRFFGMGVSGGEEGALHGPSLMPGGHEEAYRHLEPLLTKMAAQTADGACCAYMGPGGAGHYVKMVHNGIEYGIEQVICEAYDILKNALGLSTSDLRDVFAAWANSDLNSFLLEITALVLRKIDPDTGKPLVEMILDEATQKGTGKWTAQDALDLGVALPTISSSVEARIISSRRDERVAAAEVLHGPGRKFSGDRKQFVECVRQAYQIAAICCYAQGFDQLRAASAEYRYNLNLPEIARIWKGGCIIRAKMLDPIQTALRTGNLRNLMLDPHFSRIINETTGSLREVVKAAVELGTPCAALAATLGYIDSYRRNRLPANLLQGLRDYFGAHTYRRVDKPGSFHTEWNT